MSAQPNTKTVVARPRKITLEDVRRKAELVQETAQHDAEELVRTQQARVLIYAAAGVAVAVGLAFYLGTRSARRPAPAPPHPAPSRPGE